MKKVQGDPVCLDKFKPDFQHALFRTSVDVVGKHISGLLLFKTMPDSSIRIVFSSEMGFSFFDFAFLPNGEFQVYHIIPQMDKKPVITTLRKDFELILFRKMKGHAFTLAENGLLYHGFPQEKGNNYYVTDSQCTKLVKLQRASGKKPVMEAFFESHFPGETPDRLSIHHLNFTFDISLKKIDAGVTE